jgi:hypothetical protein
MTKMFMLTLVLLCSTAWLRAQVLSSQSSQTASTQTGAESDKTSVEGCLQGSNGSFTLTDNAGTTYQLQGDTSKLSKHVGHEVQITGATSESGAAPSSDTSQRGSQQHMLSVVKVKHISESCKNMSK